MYNQIRLDTIFIMLYAVVMTMALVASAYLLLRQGNAFSRGIKTPRRLRLWTAVFFGIVALGHAWYMPAMLPDSGEEALLSLMIGALLDCLLTIPLAFVVMLCMLQDRRRPLWPVAVMMAPLAVGMVACIVSRSDTLLPWLRGYFLLMTVGFTVYMVREVRRYGRWLRDNYADLEHKEVWQSFVVLAVVVMMFCYYVSGDGSMAYEFIVQVCGLAMVVYLLWRVETLQDLSFQPMADGDIALAEAQRAAAEAAEAAAEADDDTLDGDGDALEGDGGRPQPSEVMSETAIQKIGQLLHERCEGSKLYLQHDLTVTQLAQALGTNRYYLSQYFAHEGTTYNAYINTLRIAHFQALYTEAKSSDAGLSTQAKQLANLSGYRSYSTFSLAFKQRTGQSVTTWITAQELRPPIK